MLRIGQEIYHSAKSASEYLGISRGMFYRNVLPSLNKHQQKAGKRKLYKQSDLEQFRGLVAVAS